MKMSKPMLWLKGVFAAAIGGAATSVGVMIADPVTFNTGDGLERVGVVAGVSAFVSVAAYLKASPLP